MTSPENGKSWPKWLWPALAGVGIVLAFLVLNVSSYDGYFQDDELDNISFAPYQPLSQFAVATLKPTFDISNFRPPGHLYFCLMGRAFGMDFPPYMTPIVVIHLVNVLLLFLLLRRLRINTWCALAGAAFFALSSAAMDAYWKPMYIFDLLCTTFSLASIVLWTYRRWIPSFVAFWLAYKSKELAVMLPAVLVMYEYWLGERRFALLIPFLATSLSFGLQGILLNPNKNNEYTFHFNFESLKATVPFYALRIFSIPFGGCALFLLAFLRDRRVWFGLAAMTLFLFTLLFLPGRLFEAYTYLPLVGAAIAMSAAASRFRPILAWIAIAIWMPWNYRQLHHEQVLKLSGDDEAFVFVDKLQRWAAQHPQIRTLVYTAAPRVYHDWGVTAAWNLAHATVGLPALYRDSKEAAKAIGEETVAYATWDSGTRTLLIQIHSPS